MAEGPSAQSPSSLVAAQPIGGSRRTPIVWACFIAAMTLVGGFLVLTDPNPAPKVATGRSLFRIPTTSDSYRTILDVRAPVLPSRWSGIIIEHSGHPHGTVEAISRLAQTRGIEGLPYHFLIGNGNGMGDGDLHMGYRWNMQAPGAPVEWLNTPARGEGVTIDEDHDDLIRICLVGNGTNRAFSERQMERVASLVAGLQRGFDIPSSRIHFGWEFQGADGPGEHFNLETFRTMLEEARRSGR